MNFVDFHHCTIWKLFSEYASVALLLFVLGIKEEK